MGFGFIQSAESISAISELGLIFLLFMIGLEIDLKKIASAGRSITLTALVQILGGIALGMIFSVSADSLSVAENGTPFIWPLQLRSAARSSWSKCSTTRRSSTR
jgi:Kef-type K+ transport system membrane component KefB